MNMQRLEIQLTDLPDEILLLTFKNLTTWDILYSLIDVNIQFNNILKDVLSTENLILIKQRLPNGIIKLMDDSIFDRFCSQILPKIHHRIKCLTLDSSSIERVFRSFTYPNLHQISLYNIGYENIEHLFGEVSHLNIFKKQINTLNITINTDQTHSSRSDIVDILCTRILAMFTNLKCLKFQPDGDVFFTFVERLSFRLREPPTFISTSLIELHIFVEDLIECYYLLDGRLKNLHTLFVNLHVGACSIPEFPKKETIMALKRFSLTSKLYMFCYDDGLLPLLHRMSNLEELFLNISIMRSMRHESFFDGNNLKNDIINHMPKLNKFVFSIYTDLFVDGKLNHIPSMDVIQETFKDLERYQIISYMEYFRQDRFFRCHVYSNPYTMNYFNPISHSFPGGLFTYVNKVLLIDEHPFEHEFFIRISLSFPYLKILVIDNPSAQKHKHCQQENKHNHNWSIVEYPHLRYLGLHLVHDDYIEQFLNDTKARLLHDISLYVTYTSLQKVTSNFTRDRTRTNCAKVRCLDTMNVDNVPENFYTYFSHLVKN